MRTPAGNPPSAGSPRRRALIAAATGLALALALVPATIAPDSPPGRTFPEPLPTTAPAHPWPRPSGTGAAACCSSPSPSGWRPVPGVRAGGGARRGQRPSRAVVCRVGSAVAGSSGHGCLG
ncbi:SPW_0924 family protein [Streptomyces sp. NPDC046870]|uniref:SPW_0924 family protein n=1 Tax=Streptomyces sp. NPDC046870 TaxID=3155135 RepID=UPI00345325B6